MTNDFIRLKEMGWNELFGAPIREILERLGLSRVADGLESLNKRIH